MSRETAQAVASSSDPRQIGRFGAAFGWPLIPLHAALLPDGRVLSYGTDERGQQGGQFSYAVWDPTLGTASDSHLLLANTTGTDTFCSGQIIVPRTGEVLLTGGDRTINGTRNFANSDVNFFDYLTNAMRKSAQSMARPRWYPTVTTLNDGRVLITGGRDATPTTANATPELYDPATGWRILTGATNNAAYGTDNWYYPRTWSAPDGRVFVAAIGGRTFFVNPAGSGSISETPLTLAAGGYWYPAVMYQPGRILSVRQSARVQTLDLNGATPTAAMTGALSQDRVWSSATVMADGGVLVSGGSTADNKAVNVAYHTELWNPATGAWTVGASASRMRLYHSISMLLADGRVLTAGGGAPGPVTNLNGEIYEPPYLFKADGSGALAARPSIRSAPLQVGWGASFSVQVQSATAVSKVTLIKTGSATHSFDFDQRFMAPSFTQSGSTLTVQAPASANLAPPGNYLLFVFDGAGVPSVARIIRVGGADDPFPNSLTVRARATVAAGVGALMEVRIGGTLIATTEVRNSTTQDFVFPLPAVVAGGAKLDIVYTNDATINGEARSLFIESVAVNRTTLLPTDVGVVFDRGSGSAAFDGVDVVAGTSSLTTNGALRFTAPGAISSTLLLRARADIAEDIGAVLQVRVNGTLAAGLEVSSTTFADYPLRLPVAVNPGDRVDVVYVNNGSATGDRNLYIESMVLNGVTLHPNDPGVTLDIGVGAAAFDGINVIPGQSNILWNAALRFVAPSNNGPKLTVRARSSMADNVGARMQVLVAGTAVGTVEVRSPNFADYVFALPAAVNPGARVDVVFTNDGGNATEDRNLYVESLSVNGATLLPTDPGVTLDIGAGPAAFDGVNVIPGRSGILWNAALRFFAPDGNAPKVTVRARASLAANVGPLMQLFVAGTAVGSVEVRSSTFSDYLFTLATPVPSGAHVDVVFGNDGGNATEDRNLYVESITINGATLLPTSPGVTVDIGAGAAAFDGVNVIPGRTDIRWNAALRFLAP
ncbi:MAG TPA: carbohydrate-binding domain-containing protein [Burkholderiaceae bacterium]|nr:carbohydrate-binding domain-containing protein [Burkholderiaceae bacterium]